MRVENPFTCQGVLCSGTGAPPAASSALMVSAGGVLPTPKLPAKPGLPALPKAGLPCCCRGTAEARGMKCGGAGLSCGCIGVPRLHMPWMVCVAGVLPMLGKPSCGLCCKALTATGTGVLLTPSDTCALCCTPGATCSGDARSGVPHAAAALPAASAGGAALTLTGELVPLAGLGRKLGCMLTGGPPRALL